MLEWVVLRCQTTKAIFISGFSCREFKPAIEDELQAAVSVFFMKQGLICES